MCSRVAFRVLKQSLKDRLKLGLGGIETIFEPRYNIAPTGKLVTIRRDGDGHLAELRHWGLVPSWANDVDIGRRTFNARSETAAKLPSFRTAFRKHRCLVPVEGFYEWRGEKGAKEPFFIRHVDPEEQLVFAGLFEAWQGPNGELKSATILTTEPNALVAPIHNRMPVVLAPEAWEAWLDPMAADAELQSLLKPCSSDLLEAYPVDKAVGNSRAKGETLMARQL